MNEKPSYFNAFKKACFFHVTSFRTKKFQQRNKIYKNLPNKSELKNITELKNTVEGVNGQLHEVKEMISKLRDRKSEEQKEKKGMRKSEHSLRNL